jgi:hypothetical protein
MQHLTRLILLWVTLTVVVGRVHGQWASQEITLRPGWNAVYLEVQPEPRDCDAVFAGGGVESVWAWNRRFSPVQFIQNADELAPAQVDWLVYLPPQHPDRAVRNLYTLTGGRTYLIKRASNAVPFNWVVKGVPTVRSPEWISDSFNLVGFPVSRVNPPTFQSFFQPSTAHVNQPVYRLNATGVWEEILDLRKITMASGEAFWIKTVGVSDYAGPVQVGTQRRGRLDYGQTLSEQVLRIRNGSGETKTVTIRPLLSDAPSTSDYPVLAGGVPLSYWVSENRQFGWKALTTEVRSNLSAGATWELRVAVRRKDMVAFYPPVGTTEVLYQSLLEVKEEGGAIWAKIPVTSESRQVFNGGVAGGVVGLADVGIPDLPDIRAGLWVGTATIDQVSQPSDATAPTAPKPTSSPFQIRLIVHVGNNGKGKFLQHVWQMYKPGRYKPDSARPDQQIVEEGGQYVLVSDDRLVPGFLAKGYTGATLRDGQAMGRRFSTAAFGFREPIPMGGSMDVGDRTLGCTVVVEKNDPTNPFKHAYHPEHDDKDGSLKPRGEADEKEVYKITRAIELRFSDTDPSGGTDAGWEDNQVGGIYREVLAGLHKTPITAQGSFKLFHASTIGTLDNEE